MPHLFEQAPTGRSRCRGCARSIERGEVRFGERIPNPFAEGETTLWFHPACAAYKRPEPLLQTLAESQATIPDRENLERLARTSSSFRRLPRIDGAERAPSSQAKCRSCHEPVERGTWRIRLVYYEEGRFSPGGYVHLGCRKAYFERDDLLEPVMHFSAALDENERADLARAFETAPREGSPPSQ